MNFPRHLIALLACIFTMAACDKNIGSEGTEKECIELIKELRFNSIRLRVE